MEEIVKPSKLREGKARQSMPCRRAVVYLSPGWYTDPEYTRSFCKKFCEERNIELLAEPFLDEDGFVYDLTLLESPEFNKALDYCEDKKNGVNTLIVVARDTLGTNTAEYVRSEINLRRAYEIPSTNGIESVDTSIDIICTMIEEDRKEK